MSLGDYEVGNKKPPKSTQFKKGFDPRRNLNGPAGTRAEFRKLVLSIGAEVVNKKTGLTRMQRKALRMWDSKDPRDSNRILDEAFGKLVQELSVRTWRDEVIDLLRSGKVTTEQVKAELGDELASELIAAAGISGSESGEADPTGEQESGTESG